MRRFSWIALFASGCSIIVPGNGGLTPDLVDGGGRDAGPDAQQIDTDGGRDAGRDSGVDAGPACDPGLTRCGAECVDTTSSLDHCGRCDNACAATDVCRGDACFDPVVDIALGSNHTCAVQGSGQVWCWGHNETGQLGTGDFTASPLPRRVIGIDDGVAVAAAGFPFGGFPGVSCAQRRSGQMWCWGANESNQLGDGTTDMHNAPVRVAGLDGAIGLGCSRISACALRTTAPEVLCWGQMYYPDGAIHGEPSQIIGLGVPARRFEQIAVGTFHACALDERSIVACWGSNGSGALGDGTTDSRTVATDVDLSDVAEVVAGFGHTCARQASGQVWCWGSGRQIGDGGTDPSPVASPRQLTTLSNATRIFSGSTAATTCALRADGSLWCWGFNIVETNRTGTATYDPQPLEQVGLGPVERVALGMGHACALRPSGDVECWGNNDYGQLGDGTTEDRFEPTIVALP